jgi:hypothetical protein
MAKIKLRNESSSSFCCKEKNEQADAISGFGFSLANA